MCTAITYKTKNFYFGRTLDHNFSYGEEITITPRNYPIPLRHTEALKQHYAVIGTAHVAGDYPLYYDGVNEKGLGMAGLNFVGNAVYQDQDASGKNVETFELIPWILTLRRQGNCFQISISWVHPFRILCLRRSFTGYWRIGRRL